MKRETKNKIIHFVPLALMMLIVFLFSAMPAGQSEATSRTIANPIAQLFHFFSGEASLVELQDAMNWTIRKMAHGVEYMILAGTAMYAFLTIIKNRFFVVVISQLFCILYSITDEIHQYFVPGRYMAVIDVVIDSTGALLGVILYVIYLKRKKKW